MKGNDKTSSRSKNNQAVLKKKLMPYAYLAPTIILMVVLLIVPIVMVIQYSFYDNVIINKNPVFVGLENFKKILSDSTFYVAVKNTLFFVAVSVIAHLIIGMFFAMLLNTRYLGDKTKGIFRVIYALPWMFTASVIAILWKMMLNPNGVINYLLQYVQLTGESIEWLGSRQFALLAVTFINIWSGYPFYMISILAGLQGISTDLYEASALDGANSIQTFFRITIPQLSPILISLIMLDFVWTIQQFALIWMTTGGGPINATEMVSTYIYKQGFSKYQYSMASASAVILLIVCTIIAIFYVRHQKARE
ncbi:carbohydrate ABC transporter permease [Faecalicatena contorta]|uniref:Carbohydrate ABC transporter membrane protein 1, CUT1 family n=1 Tax=Faecalicatena contorta TaxID=39482 RepID=A0A315ZNH3_9FIRM|nr:sugar ABC transporter permease [Faecalicatena contorta]PWJ47165.1 carbohydrate ABC transporter membrane protein 1 (CUT1 family) [Faecalicatena contorta]SUQ16140.1 carbohydrate ABC transporter membrane protein 1, CUT1 family [Faecalicatena contorta]